MSNRPPPSSQAVSDFMKRMPRANTGPELALRRALHRLGNRFRLHDASLPGTPDLVFRGPKVAVFVDGCFWHGCEDHAVLPKNNSEFWYQKIAGNRERDQRVDAALRELGWISVRVWEHEDPEAAAGRVAALCQEGLG